MIIAGLQRTGKKDMQNGLLRLRSEPSYALNTPNSP